MDIAAGVAFIGYSDYSLDLYGWIGLLLVILDVIGFTVTEVGSKFQRLSVTQKCAAIGALLSVFIAIFGIWIALSIMEVFFKSGMANIVVNMVRNFGDDIF